MVENSSLTRDMRPEIRLGFLQVNKLTIEYSDGFYVTIL